MEYNYKCTSKQTVPAENYKRSRQIRGVAENLEEDQSLLSMRWIDRSQKIFCPIQDLRAKESTWVQTRKPECLDTDRIVKIWNPNYKIKFSYRHTVDILWDETD